MPESLPFAISINSRPLKYGLPFKKSPGLFRTQFTPVFEKQLNTLNKKHLPVFDLWSNDFIKLIAADFDHLPPEFKSNGDNGDELAQWGLFREHLRTLYGEQGLVLRSPSGKAKILFKTELPIGTPMTKTIALDTLDRLLERSEREAIDRCKPAANRLFVNLEMYQAMREGLDSIPILMPDLGSLVTEPETEPVPCQDPENAPPDPPERAIWNILPFGAAELDPFNSLLKNQAEWFLIRYIAGSPTLALNCIALPQPFIVDQSKLYLECPLSLAGVSRGIQALLALGLLRLVDDHYAPGRKAKHYRAEGLLRDLVEFQLLKPKAPADAAFLKDDIPDGHWNEVLWKATNYFSTKGAFLEWATNKPGIEQKDRERKATIAWVNHSSPRFNPNAKNKRLLIQPDKNSDLY